MSPGGASHTYGIALITRIAVPTRPVSHERLGRAHLQLARHRRVAVEHDPVGAVARAVGQSGATSFAMRLTCSITIASRPSTTPIVSKRTAATVPGSITPAATSSRRSVTRFS